MVRSLVISPHEDMRTWLKYASLCGKSGRLVSTKGIRILRMEENRAYLKSVLQTETRRSLLTKYSAAVNSCHEEKRHFKTFQTGSDQSH